MTPVLSQGSLNLAQFRSGFDFFGPGWVCFLCFVSLFTGYYVGARVLGGDTG
jgi:hypothetical protein